MKVLQCPCCGEVMHRVQEPTLQSRMAGIDQLARHNAEQHVIPHLEAMLELAASYRLSHDMSVEDLKEMLRVRCGKCRKTIREDSYRYRREDGRTFLYCSDDCLRLAA